MAEQDDSTAERWLPVVGYEGIYEVSDLGRVRRVLPAMGARVGHALSTDRGARHRVAMLRKGGTGTILQVRALVLRAFIGECPADCEPANLNGSNGDVRLANLAWRLRGPSVDGPERWLPVVDWEGWYEVSDLGRVRRSRPGHGTRPGRTLKISADKDHYPSVRLSRPGRRSPTAEVHVLVLRAFQGPCPPGMEARHLNGDKRDARASNLEWNTRLVNAGDRIAHGTVLRGERCPWARLDSATVRLVREMAGSGMQHKQIAADLGLDHRAVGKIVRRETWAHVT